MGILKEMCFIITILFIDFCGAYYGLYRDVKFYYEGYYNNSMFWYWTDFKDLRSNEND